MNFQGLTIDVLSATILGGVAVRRTTWVVTLAAIDVVVLLSAFPVHGEKPVCEKDTPATGNVPDPDWAFSYSSWSEPYATDALKYFYSFTNQTDHNVPVRWIDANIIRIKTLPGLSIESDKVDAIPAGLFNSTISVGMEGAGQKSYPLKNCFSDSSPPNKEATNRKYGTAFHFMGKVVPVGSNKGAVTLDIDFRSEIEGSFLRTVPEGRQIQSC